MARQQQTVMTAARITALVSLGTLLCCLCCCAVPGAIALGVANYVFEEWPVVDAILIDKTECDDDVYSNTNNYDNNNNNNNNYDQQQQDPIGYYLTYNYVTLDGENITSTTTYCTSITTSTSIRYNPDDPTDILDDLLLTIGLYASRIMTGLGWCCVIVALGLTIWSCTWQQPQEPQNNNTTNTNDIEIPGTASTVNNDPNKPIYATATAVGVPAGNSDVGNSYGGGDYGGGNYGGGNYGGGDYGGGDYGGGGFDGGTK